VAPVTRWDKRALDWHIGDLTLDPKLGMPREGQVCGHGGGEKNDVVPDLTAAADTVALDRRLELVGEPAHPAAPAQGRLLDASDGEKVLAKLARIFE
jgi:hypothetical protein